MPKAPSHFVLVSCDGVILPCIPFNDHVSSLRHLEFLPQALQGLHLLAKHGYGILMLCARHRAGRDQLCAHQLRRITQRIRLEVALSGGRIERVYCCPHLRSGDCDCWIPKPGLLTQALTDFGLVPGDVWMVGATLDDMEAGEQAGCRGILVRRNSFLRPETTGTDSYVVVSNLFEAAELILSTRCDPEWPQRLETTRSTFFAI